METLAGGLVLLLILALGAGGPILAVAWLYRRRVGSPDAASLRLRARLQAPSEAERGE